MLTSLWSLSVKKSMSSAKAPFPRCRGAVAGRGALGGPEVHNRMGTWGYAITRRGARRWLAELWGRGHAPEGLAYDLDTSGPPKSFKYTK